MTYNPYGFNSSYLDMAQDLGDPRRQRSCQDTLKIKVRC